MTQPATVSCRLDHIQWPAALVDPQLRIRAANAKFVERWTALGGSLDDLSGRSLALLCPLEEQLKIRHESFRHSTGVPLCYSLTLTSPPTVLELTPIESRNEPGGWLATLRDDEEHAEGPHMDRIRIASLLHDLKAPVQAALGWMSLLRKKQLEGDRLDNALGIIERNVCLEASLLNELLEMTHLTGRLPERRPTAVDIAELARSTIDALRPAADEAGLELRTPSPAGPVLVAGDAQDLARIVSNLVVNAIKFSNRGGIIECSVAEQGEWVRLAVRDQGCGISPDFLPHVFDSFRREPHAEAAMREGTGLGLSVVRQLARRHGGRVRAASGGRGCGATFEVMLRSARMGGLAAQWQNAAAS